MRLILRGDKLSAKKYIGFAKARLNDMKNIMSALSLDYNRKYYKLPDAELVVESRCGLDSAWIVGKGIRIINLSTLDTNLLALTLDALGLLHISPVSVGFMLESVAPDSITFNNTPKIWDENGNEKWVGSTSSDSTMTAAQPSFGPTISSSLILSDNDPLYYGAQLNYVSGAGSISMPDRDGGVAAYILSGSTWVTGDHNIQANFTKVGFNISMGAEKPTVFPPPGEGVDILSSSMPVARVAVEITPITIVPAFSANYSGSRFAIDE